MWSLIIVLWFANGGNAIGVTHVDNFISKQLCEKAGERVIKTVKDVNIQYSCVLEID